MRSMPFFIRLFAYTINKLSKDNFSILKLILCIHYYYIYLPQECNIVTCYFCSNTRCILGLREFTRENSGSTYKKDIK